jgi:hypothetical protein
MERATQDPRNRDGQENLLVSDAILGRTLALCGADAAAIQLVGEARIPFGKYSTAGSGGKSIETHRDGRVASVATRCTPKRSQRLVSDPSFDVFHVGSAFKLVR